MAATKTTKKAPAKASNGNPFDKKEDPRRYAVAQKMLASRKTAVSWDDLKAAAGGTLSPRTMGAILRTLEDAGHAFERTRESNVTYYQYLPGVKPTPAKRLGKTTGGDATGVYNRSSTPAKKKTAPAKGTTKKVSKLRRGGADPVKSTTTRKKAAKAPAKKATTGRPRKRLNK